MQRVTLETIEKYDEAKFFRAEVFKGQRFRTLLLCLAPGQSVPSHRHEGFETILESFMAMR
jgi:quercetin dioxygenase-like cupin family protein